MPPVTFIVPEVTASVASSVMLSANTPFPVAIDTTDASLVAFDAHISIIAKQPYVAIVTVNACTLAGLHGKLRIIDPQETSQAQPFAIDVDDEIAATLQRESPYAIDAIQRIAAS